MSKAYTCTTPEEGWALYSHFLSNRLMAIRFLNEIFNTKTKNGEYTDKEERGIEDFRANLVGNLYMIMKRMDVNGHNEVARKMQQIIDIILELDITDSETHKKIFDKQRELNINKSEFGTKLAKLMVKYEK